ncbi:hypothetical protein DM860_014393 [Cuscuta australis]|uniref:Dof zinc finger protein n=1 Tax=Cuscuta australis TaxID=267555 RepID=A0A328DDC6_9ASTE|nr:hypothetical protein DM860_014393 [Cuscuta australis]
MNTKFCYFNNYNLSQPRHFCKNCKRYWTKGGALRNIPVGGGTRKSTTKRSSSTTTAAPSSPPNRRPPAAPPQKSDEPFRIAGIPGFDVNASFTSLLTTASGGGRQFGSLLGGSDLQLGEFPGNPNSIPTSCPGPNGVAHIGMGLMNRTHPGWPDLSMYTPDPTFHQ